MNTFIFTELYLIMINCEIKILIGKKGQQLYKCLNVRMLECLDWRQLGQLEKTTF